MDQMGFLQLIIASGLSVITLMFSYIVYEVRSSRRELLDLMERDRSEGVINSKRIDVLDSTLSDITQKKFNSRVIVNGGLEIPRVHSKISRIVHEQ